MKKFIDYLIEQERQIQYDGNSAEPKDEKETPLGFYAKLDIPTRQSITNDMIEIFTKMLKNTNKFNKAIKFILDNNPDETENNKSIMDKVKRFFQNPLEKGLPYISGENQIVNGPNSNPNMNGSVNNSYVNNSPINSANYQ